VTPEAKPPPDNRLSALAGQLTGNVTRLVSEHLALARVEFKDALRESSSDFAQLLGAALFVFIGYGFLCAALSAVLARWLGVAGSLGVVGGIHVLAGGLWAWVRVRRLQEREWLKDSTQALQQTAELLEKPVHQLPHG